VGGDGLSAGYNGYTGCSDAVGGKFAGVCLVFLVRRSTVSYYAFAPVPPGPTVIAVLINILFRFGLIGAVLCAAMSLSIYLKMLPVSKRLMRLVTVLLFAIKICLACGFCFCALQYVVRENKAIAYALKCCEFYLTH
jgi:hypothetical protein